jgi:hypothetical protein
MTAEIKETVQILSAALAPTTAIVAVSLAFSQYRLERAKFRHQLYERRLAIYTSTAKLLATIMSTAKAELKDLFEFTRETNQSYFLFGADISDYLDEIYRQGVTLRSQNQKMDNSIFPTEEARARVIDQNDALLKWFADQLSVSRKKFAPYIRLDR